jgi:hypothetical protein
MTSTEWIRGKKAVKQSKKGIQLFINKNGTWNEADNFSAMLAHMLPEYALFDFGVKK